MADIYAITGFVWDTKGQVPFGGFFQLRGSLPNMDLEGNLSDCYGASTIRGTFQPEQPEERLDFSKTYVDRETIINYSFKLHGSGLWVGEYHWEDIAKGAVVCKITKHWQDILSGTRVITPEEQTSKLVQHLIDIGRLPRAEHRVTLDQLLT